MFQLFLLQIDRDSSIHTLDVIFGQVYDVINHLICIVYLFFKLKYLWNQCRYLQKVSLSYVINLKIQMVKIWYKIWYNPLYKARLAPHCECSPGPVQFTDGLILRPTQANLEQKCQLLTENVEE